MTIIKLCIIYYASSQIPCLRQFKLKRYLMSYSVPLPHPPVAVVEDLVQDVAIQAAFAEIDVSQQIPTDTAPVDQQEVSHEKWIYCLT